MILVSSNIQSIFRLRGKDINFDLNDIIYFIATKEPKYFNMDMISRLKPSIRPETLKSDEDLDFVLKKRIMYDDFGLHGDSVKRMIEIAWKNLAKSFDRFWIRLIVIAYLNPGQTIDELRNTNKDNHIKTDDLIEIFFILNFTSPIISYFFEVVIPL